MTVSVKKIAGSVFMKKNATKGFSIGKVFGKIGHFLYTRLILGVFNFFKNIVQKIFDFFKNIFAAAKNHPKSFKRGLGSFFLMGFGQLRNKQWYKAIPIFLMLTVFILIEISTSSYIYAIGEISTYAPREGILYFFRDYGGFFTKGIWGFFTLGKLVLGDAYRGQMIVVYDRIMTWKSADNSQVLLGEGIIAIVLILILFITWIFSIKDAYATHLKVQETGKLETFNIFIKRVWNDYFAYIIIIPSAVLIFFFTLIPFLFSFLVAFTNWTGRISLGEMLFKWTFFDTFKLVFSSAEWLQFFGDVLVWTLFYALMSSVTVYVLGLIQAIIIESKAVVFKKFWRIILILPWAIPGMISLMLFRNVFADNGGLMNQVLANLGATETVKDFLKMLGLVGQTDLEAGLGNILWLTSPQNGGLAKALIIIVNLWLGYPYFMMLITGVLGTIPESLYEAAQIDGASESQKFRFITMPMVLRATAPVIITTFTFNFNNFGAIYFLSGGGPGYPIDQIPQSVRVLGAQPGQTDILISWIYKLSFRSSVNQYNLASVYSILIFIFIGLAAIYNLSKLKSFWEED
jgi:arabinogalactan oligomer / maltooligosaccharide transport system permease protein